MPQRAAQHRPNRPAPKDTRPSAAQRGYDGRWQQYRIWYLARHPICMDCYREYATVVDHIKPHKGNDDLFWDESNHRSLCKRCHDRATALYDGGFGREVKKKPEIKK